MLSRDTRMNAGTKNIFPKNPGQDGLPTMV